MNLAEFIRQNDIKCVDGAEFDHSPDFYKMQQFEKTCHTITDVPFLEPETYIVKEFDIHLTGFINEKWNKAEKKTKRQFFINRSFMCPDMPNEFETIEDSLDAGKTIDDAIAVFEAEKNRFEFFKQFDLIDTGRYWLNRELKRCLVMDGQVIVIDE
ncbi:MAG: hypothetical protein ABIG61_14865 [Planctomycetota bacterium]